jgi:hypothetical protein
MKIVIAIVLAGILTGCVHNVSCPPGLGEPGELCTRVMIPTPIDPLIATVEAIAAVITVMDAE